jgi:hypothetical protein
MGRSLFAIASGFAVVAGLSIATDFALIMALPSLHDDRGLTDSVTVLLLTIAYVALYIAGGGYLAARLAPAHAVRHAIAVGACGVLFLAAGSATRWDQAPLWYHVGVIAMALPCAWIGGRWCVRELAERPHSTLSGARAA